MKLESVSPLWYVPMTHFTRALIKQEPQIIQHLCLKNKLRSCQVTALQVQYYYKRTVKVWQASQLLWKQVHKTKLHNWLWIHTVKREKNRAYPLELLHTSQSLLPVGWVQLLQTRGRKDTSCQVLTHLSLTWQPHTSQSSDIDKNKYYHYHCNLCCHLMYDCLVPGWIE